VVVHGDWRLGNMQCEADRINGVIDWEIWALGDPRLDLSWFLMWADPVHPLAVNTGMRVPSVVELRAEYEKLRGAVPDLEWFDALARYKQAAACALLVKNARKRGDPDTRFTILDTRIGAMLEASAACL
jgi:aminoglycoside phosphotransferase (APT) family kinase protein